MSQSKNIPQNTFHDDVKSVLVGIYEDHLQVETAIKILQKAGIPMAYLSIIGKDYRTEEHPVGFYTFGDRVRTFGKIGAFWGAFVGLLSGLGFFFVPGVGPLFVAGPLLAVFISMLEGAVVVGGVNALIGSLISLGIPKNTVIKYETALKIGHFILVAHGTAEELQTIQQTLGTDHAVYQPSIEAAPLAAV